MAWKVLLLVFLAVPAFAIPPPVNDVFSALKDGPKRYKPIPGLLEPGPIIIRGNDIAQESPEPEQSAECVICEFAMSELKSLIGQNSTQDEIKVALNKVCSLLPSSISKECASFVNTYEEEVLKILSQELNPDMVCTSLGLCSGVKQAVLVKDAAGGGPYCALCEFVMEKLDNELKDNATEQEIEEALSKVCGYLPSSIRSECDALVKEYGPMIIQLLVQELDPSVICKELGLCTQKRQTEGLEEAPQLNSVTCEVCTVVMSYLDDTLKENATEEEIKEALDKVCSYLPSSIKSECTALVDEYSDAIINAIVSGLQPEMVCAEIGLCTGKNLEAQESKTECKFCVGLLTEVFKNNATAEQALQSLKRVCALIPDSPYRTQCDKLATVGERIFNLLMLLGPQKACELIKVCPASNLLQEMRKPFDMVSSVIASTSLDRISSIMTVKGNISCKVCIAVIDGFKEIAAENRTQCTAFIDDNLPKLFKLIENLNSKQICQDIGACPKLSFKFTDIRCHLGAVYRCSSRAAAKRCDSLSYCKKYVWNE
ncbi:prosaposin isoform X2 [Nematostella vectensis]|uniref:prosaposin isoform X2 n=1 Tax=Nematostella vectensis TaxID=45351 RepID=UPI0020773224|nr:prosaposin isoform X2 [Nematostella vectensis]